MTQKSNASKQNHQTQQEEAVQSPATIRHLIQLMQDQRYPQIGHLPTVVPTLTPDQEAIAAAHVPQIRVNATPAEDVALASLGTLSQVFPDLTPQHGSVIYTLLVQAYNEGVSQGYRANDDGKSYYDAFNYRLNL